MNVRLFKYEEELKEIEKSIEYIRDETYLYQLNQIIRIKHICNRILVAEQKQIETPIGTEL